MPYLFISLNLCKFKQINNSNNNNSNNNDINNNDNNEKNNNKKNNNDNKVKIIYKKLINID